MCSINGHHCNCGLETGLLVELTKAGMWRGGWKSCVCRCLPGWCEEGRFKEELGLFEHQGSRTSALNQRTRIFCIQAEVVGTQVNPREEMETEGAGAAWVGSPRAMQTAPRRASRESFVMASVLGRVCVEVTEGLQGPRLLPYFLSTAPSPSAWPHKGPGCFIRSHLHSFYDPPGTIIPAQAQTFNGFLSIQIFLMKHVFSRS